MTSRKRSAYEALGAAAYGKRSGRKIPARRRISYGLPAGQVVGPIGGGKYGASKDEKKVSDLAVATYQANTTGAFTLLHVPTLGTDYTNRIGRKTLAKSIYIRGRVTTEVAAAAGGTTKSVEGQLVRLIVFVDLQPNANNPAIAVTDILNTADPASQLNLNNRDRFRILKDKQWCFDPYIVSTATNFYASASRQVYPVKIFKKCMVESVFNGTNGGSIADLNSGAIYMLTIGSAAAGTNTDANLIVSTRVRYVDA